MLIALLFTLIGADDQKTPKLSGKQKAEIIFGGVGSSALIMLIIGWISLKFMKPLPEVEYIEVNDSNQAQDE